MEGQMKKSIIWNEYEKEIAFMKSEINTFTMEANKIDDSQWSLEKRREKIKKYCETLAQELKFAYESETYVNQAETCIQFLKGKATVFPYIETVIDTFISGNIDNLSSLDNISAFEKSICLGANISPAGMSGIQRRRYDIDYDANSSTYLIGALYWKIKYELSSSQREIERLKDKLEMLTKLLQEIIGIDERILWLVCHQLILDSVVKHLAENWIFTYPYFQDFESEESALSGYVSLEFNQHYFAWSKDFFKFICWLAYKLDITDNFFSFAQRIATVLPEFQKKNEYLKFKAKMLPQENDSARASSSVTIETVDQYSGIEFERFVGSLFQSDGYRIEYTLTSNDKGVDIIARRNGISIGIQCKCYSSSVGISAIQEAFAGKNFYQLDKAMVITNSHFTRAAKDLAKSTNVTLWDRSILIARMSLS